MQKINIEILNDEKASKTGSIVTPIQFSEEGTDLMRVIGKALSLAADALTKQHDAPIVKVNGLTLAEKDIKVLKMKKRDFFKFRENFNVVQNTVAAILMSTSVDLQEQYIRKTDINGYYKGTKSFTQEQFDSQVVAFNRATKLAVKYAKEDAQTSTMPDALLRRHELAMEVSRAKRLEAKKQMVLENN